MTPLLTICALWLLLSIILAPVIGGFLRRRRRRYPKWPPLPSGSLHDRDGLHQ